MKVSDLVKWIEPEAMGCKEENAIGIIIDIGSPKYFGYGKYAHFELLQVMWTHMTEMSYPRPHDVMVINES